MSGPLNPLSHDVIISAATRLVRVCVRLYPRRFRDEYGSEMEALFRGRMVRASAAGIAPLMLALLNAFQDLLTGAVAERVPRRRMLAADRAAEERRDSMRISLLDFKLALRMTAKYPGLSAIAVCGLAVAIGMGAGYFAFVGSMLDSTLPFEDGDRIVAIQSRDLRSGRAGGTPLEDVQHWRNDLRTIETLAAFSEHSRNLTAEDGRTEIATVAAMTPSAFRLADVAPVLGRTIRDEDERPGATPVLVIGHEEWQQRFDGDARVIGRTMRVDETVHTIVGVMPKGFGFPIRHAYWVPLRLDVTGAQAKRDVHVVGRLRHGVTLAQVQAEVSTIGERMAAAFPHSHGDLRLHVGPYTRAHGSFSSESPEVEMAARALQFGVGLLVLIIAVNVSVLVYARTATRLGEIAVRTALGASRGRIVSQLFVEALVLSASAAAIGLGLVSVAFRVLLAYDAANPYSGRPFWMQLELTPGVAAYAAVLAVVGAVMIGVLPALKATRRQSTAALQQFSGRAAGVQLGRTWTALIVLQVAIAVMALPGALHFATVAYRHGVGQPSPLAHSLIEGVLYGTSDDNQSAERRPARFQAGLARLVQQLGTEPGVTGVTYADVFPGREPYTRIDVEGQAEPVPVKPSRVAPNLFDIFGVNVIAGRTLTTADANTTAIIVDQRFADALGGHVLGRRIRYSRVDPDGAPQSSPWHEIVGIVPVFWESFHAFISFNAPVGRIYHAGTTKQIQPAVMVVRVADGGTGRWAPRLRDLTASIDPTLKFGRIAGVPERWSEETGAAYLVSLVVIAVTASVLLLSSAGIYAMMSFTVARRRREIGIRAALGADARRVLLGIFGLASAQIGAGVAVGLLVAVLLHLAGAGTMFGGNPLVLVPGVIALMFAVGIVATLGPARRGLAVQPTEALRDE
jgi:putative ABC transport system permease protein